MSNYVLTTSTSLDEIMLQPNWEEIVTSDILGLRIDRRGNKEGLVIIKYFLHQANFNYLAARQARGIIYDLNLGRCVCRPFDKFFNYGEQRAAKIDWRTAVAREKEDGSLLKIWRHPDGELMVSSNGMIDASFRDNDDSLSLAMIAHEAPNWYPIRTALDKERGNLDCHMFELTSPHNRVVVDHSDTKLTYLGSRTPEGSEYLYPPFLPYFVESYPIYSIEEALAFVNHRGLAHEGLVIEDASHQRIKVKSAVYSAAHHNISKESPRHLADAIVAGEGSELSATVPMLADRIKEYQDAYDQMMYEAKRATNEVMGLSRKDQALHLQKNYSPVILGVVFAGIDGREVNLSGAKLLNYMDYLKEQA